MRYRLQSASQKWTPLLSFCLLSNFITSSIILLWRLFKLSKNKEDTDVSRAIRMFLNHHKPITYIHPQAWEKCRKVHFSHLQKNTPQNHCQPKWMQCSINMLNYPHLTTNEATLEQVFLYLKWELLILPHFPHVSSPVWCKKTKTKSQQREFSGVQEGKRNYGFSASVHGLSWFWSGCALRASSSVVSSHASQTRCLTEKRALAAT